MHKRQKMSQIRLLPSVLLCVGALLASNVMAAEAAPEPASELTSESALAMPCSIGISGLQVELGVSSLRQCISYARSSMLGKDDIKSRVIKFGQDDYRVAAQLLETSHDGGQTWQLETAAAPVTAKPSSETAAVTELLENSAAVVDKAAIVSVAKSPAASEPSPVPSPVVAVVVVDKVAEAESSSANVDTTGSKAVDQAAMVSLPQSAPASEAAPTPSPVVAVVVAAEATEATEANSSTENVDPASAVPAPEPAAALSSVGDPIIVAALPAVHTCEFKINGAWLSLLASSAKECGEKIQEKGYSDPKQPIPAYWNQIYLNLFRGILYVSADGVHWSISN